MILSAEEFVQLLDSENMFDNLRAGHEEGSVEIWLDVIAKYPDMKRWVAYNKKLPEEIIRILAKDPDSDVRERIARKRKTPPDVLMDLAHDEDESVRSSVAANAKAPREILEFLLSDTAETVVDIAQRRLQKRFGSEAK